MDRDWLAAILHILIVAAIYAVYSSYPPYSVPIPYFDSLCLVIGTTYGAFGIIMLKRYVENAERTQREFNMAVLVIFIGLLIFMAESIGNAA